MPLLSVLTVAFNAAATIADTLRSVRAQKGADLEHIVIDGGSTDATMAVVEQYRDGLAAVVSEPDKGIYDAMNKGLALARGTYLGCLNADDYFASPASLATIAAALAPGNGERGPDCAWGDLVHVDANGRPVRLMSGRIFRPALLRFAVMPPHPTFYARTQSIRQAGGFDTSYKIAGDFDLMLKLFAQPGFTGRYVNTIVTAMRMGGVSTNGLRATRTVSAEMRRALQANGMPASPLNVLARYPLKAKELIHGQTIKAKGKSFKP